MCPDTKSLPGQSRTSRCRQLPPISLVAKLSAASTFLILICGSERMLMPSVGSLNCCIHSQHFEHQLHGHQHGVVAAHEPPFGETAGMVDQRDIDVGTRRAVAGRRDLP